jgi:aquaporin Z
VKKYAAEFFGTFILVGVGGYTVVAGVASGLPPVLTAPFGFGLGLLAAIFAVGHVSGGHFNPAVTLAMVIDRRMPPLDVAGYVIAQIAGGIVAAYAVVASTWGEAAQAATFINNGPGMQGEIGKSFLLETILTAIFVLVILVSTRSQPASAPFAIGWTLTVVHFAGVPFTGLSVNPARSIGPAIAAGTYDALWVFIVAPLAGAVIAWVISVLLPAKAEAT